jgi:hypothetical protein
MREREGRRASRAERRQRRPEILVSRGAIRLFPFEGAPVTVNRDEQAGMLGEPPHDVGQHGRVAETERRIIDDFEVVADIGRGDPPAATQGLRDPEVLALALFAAPKERGPRHDR